MPHFCQIISSFQKIILKVFEGTYRDFFSEGDDSDKALYDVIIFAEIIKLMKTDFLSLICTFVSQYPVSVLLQFQSFSVSIVIVQ